MKSKYLFLLFIVAALLFSGCNNSLRGKDQVDMEKESVYTKLWAELESLDNQGLSRQALKKAEEIYELAKKSEYSQAMIKSFIYIQRYRAEITENTAADMVKELEGELTEIKSPAKEVMASILAGVYEQYYRDNIYSIRQRTPLAEGDEGDLLTWDADRILDRITELYLASLENRSILQKQRIESYSLLLNKGNMSEQRPTLYDFLAHRAVDFFISEVTYLNRPAYTFVLEDEELFGSGARFSRFKLQGDEQFSLKLQALKIMQELTAFRLKDKSGPAMVDLELKRLNYVRSNSILPEKDELYLAALEELNKKYAKEPSSGMVSYYIALYHRERAAHYNPLAGARYKEANQTAVSICDDVISRFPESEGAYNCESLKAEIKNHELSFQVEKANLPGTPFRALVSYRNVDELYLKVVRLGEKERERAEQISYNRGQEEVIKYYVGLPTVTESHYELPGDSDFNSHSSEIMIPALDRGNYIILLSAKKDFSISQNAIAYQGSWVSSISFLHSKDSSERDCFYLLDRDSGRPLEGVKGQVYFRHWDYKKNRYANKKGKSYNSDRLGYMEVSGKSNESYIIEFTLGDDILRFEDNYYLYESYKESPQPYRTIFFTDRAIYRPGQTIYFKGITIEYGKDGKSRKIAPGQKTTVQLFDVNSQPLSSLELTSSDYGTFSGQFTAPQGVLTGNMTIRNEYGSHSFSVEEYKRPKFEVLFKDLEKSYRLGEKVSVKGEAKAFSGANIDGAEVKYRVVREAYFPYWRWWWYTPPSSRAEIVNGETESGADGSFSIDFEALPDREIDKESQPVFRYTVYADVTDINGETHSSQTTLTIGYVALELNIKMNSFVEREVPGKVTLETGNFNGGFEPAGGEVTVYPLVGPDRVIRARLWQRPDSFLYSREEFKKLFPHDVYENEDDFRSWERGKPVMTTDFNTANSKELAFNNISSWRPGRYLLKATTKDRYGTKVEQEFYFTLHSAKEKTIPVKQAVWYRPIKIKGQPGEKASFELGSSEKAHFIYEVVHDGRVIERKEVTLNNEKKLISIDIEEKMRGNFAVHINGARYNRGYSFNQPILVDWSNKLLNIEFETFRNKLLPGENEEWRLKLSGPEGEKLAAEMVATLYDASLEQFRVNSWPFNIYPYFYSSRNWSSGKSFSSLGSYNYIRDWNIYKGIFYRQYDSLNYHGLLSLLYGRVRYLRKERSRAYDEFGEMESAEEPTMMMEVEEKEMVMEEEMDKVSLKSKDERMDAVDFDDGAPGPTAQEESGELAGVKARTNFNETAFFYPHLKTDSEGRVIISFTIPEALTRWKMLGFAHTKDLKYGLVENELVTQKELMVVPNVPRFLREGDTIVLSTKISNLAPNALDGEAELTLFDPETMQPLDSKFTNLQNRKRFKTAKGSSTSLEWDLKIPKGLGVVGYRVVAKAGAYSDGEESALPILSNRMLVTESLPLNIRGGESREYTFEKLINSGDSNTLSHERLTLEFTSNPAWYAVQALPYLMEFPHECSEQLFSRYYANSIATHVAHSSPRIREIFESWKDSEALLSNLHKNEELKSLLLEETPWVLEANDEAERKKRLGLLFDMTRMSGELKKSYKKLKELQTINGGWPWFSGLPEDRYITSHILAGLGHLDRMGARSLNQTDDRALVEGAIRFLDNKMQEDYNLLVRSGARLSDDHLGYIQTHYLYARSYFPEIKVPGQYKKAHDYWKGQAKKYWLSRGEYMQGMISLALFRLGDKKTAKAITTSLKERAIFSDELGMYWKDVTYGYYWYQAPIETQALLIEVFDEVANDSEAVEELKIWLLKQKQTTDWKTTKATAEACYALLLKGTNLLSSDKLVEIALGGARLDPAAMGADIEEGTGRFKVSWQGEEVKPEMGNVSLKKEDAGIGWGALYWQYFEQLDKITFHETPLSLEKELYLEKNTARGPVLTKIQEGNELQVGDLVKVRIILRVDREMEYIHLKDMRASSFEPINVLSTYRYQDGLWYYESIRDSGVNFFIPWLPKGTYLFEYPLRVTHKGEFSNGITTIQSMYAPEFTSHSAGIRVKVK